MIYARLLTGIKLQIKRLKITLTSPYVHQLWQSSIFIVRGTVVLTAQLCFLLL